MAFRAGSIDGVVGLGSKPRVELYCRGILVWRGTTLDELRYGAKHVEDAPYPEGLATTIVYLAYRRSKSSTSTGSESFLS